MDDPTSVSKESLQQTFLDTHHKIKEFISWGNLAPLATADDVLPVLTASYGQLLQPPTFIQDADAELLRQRLLVIEVIIAKLQAAARKDLWDPPQRAKAEGTTQP